MYKNVSINVFKASLKENRELSNRVFPKEMMIGIPKIIPLKNIIISIQAILISHFVKGSIMLMLSKFVTSDSLLWFEENILIIKFVNHIKITTKLYQEYVIQKFVKFTKWYIDK